MRRRRPRRRSRRPHPGRRPAGRAGRFGRTPGWPSARHPARAWRSPAGSGPAPARRRAGAGRRARRPAGRTAPRASGEYGRLARVLQGVEQADHLGRVDLGHGLLQGMRALTGRSIPRRGLPRLVPVCAGQLAGPPAEQGQVTRPDPPPRPGQQPDQVRVGGDVVDQPQRRGHVHHLGQMQQATEADDLHRHVTAVSSAYSGAMSALRRVSTAMSAQCATTPLSRSRGDLVADPADLLRPGVEGRGAYRTGGSLRRLQQSEPVESPFRPAARTAIAESASARSGRLSSLATSRIVRPLRRLTVSAKRRAGRAVHAGRKSAGERHDVARRRARQP